VVAGYGATDYADAILHWLRRGKGQARIGVGAPFLSNECVTTTPVPPSFTRIYLGVPPSTPPPTPLGTGPDNPFDVTSPDKFDDLLRKISEQDNPVTLNGTAVGPTNLTVCIAPGTFQTRGTWDYLIGLGHTNNPDPNKTHPVPGQPGGFTANQNWHVHGAGMDSTILQLSQFLPNPTNRGFPPNSGLGLVLGTHDLDSSGVEISDLAIDGNYANLKSGSTVLNLLAINLLSTMGHNYIHRVKVVGTADEAGPEAFPIGIASDGQQQTNEQNSGNLIEYVVMQQPETPQSNISTAMVISEATGEVRFNVVNGYYNGYGGWNMSHVWFHDNFALNNINGVNIDSNINRDVLFQFNQITNPAKSGIVIGATATYNNFDLQYNTIAFNANSSNLRTGITVAGNVNGALVTRNNIVTNINASNVTGIGFLLSGNIANKFEFNQFSSAFNMVPAPPQNCVFSDWNESGVQLTNFPNTQSSPCGLPLQGSPIAAAMNTIANTKEVDYVGDDQHIHSLWYNGPWSTNDLTADAGAPSAAIGSPVASAVNTIAHTMEVDYFGSDQHVHSLWYNGFWHAADLTALAGGVNAASGSPLTAAVNTIANTMEVDYLGDDHHVHSLWYSGSWHAADLTALAGGVNAASGSPLTAAVNTIANTMEVDYLGDDQHVHSLWYSGSWHAADLTALAGAVNAASSSLLTAAVNTIANTMEVNYIGGDQHIYVLWYNGLWHVSDLTVATLP
jgi:hypothetical protein